MSMHCSWPLVPEPLASEERSVKYSIVTFGCRVNQADSLRIEEDLRARGGVAAPSSDADLVIVNTCSVTASADQGARQTIRRIARDNPAASVVVTGCYATRRPHEVAALPNVIRVVGNHEKDWLVQTTAERFGDGEGACGAPIAPGVAGRTAFTLRVQTGCEERCSYCIIPTTRGAGRSLPLDDVVREVARVAAAGFKEIALTGVHLGSYGRDLLPPSSLAVAPARARLVRARPDIQDQLARADGLHAGYRRPCRRKRRALRAAFSPAAAARERSHARPMRRPYTLDYYRDLVDSIVDRLPHASIGTDMIVGFPGETDDDFRANLDYLPTSPLSHVHVFPYSDRPGTAATGMPDKVPGAVIRERAAPAARDRRRADAAISRGADRNRPARPDNRGRHARRDRQLSESQDSGGIGAQPPHCREAGP